MTSSNAPQFLQALPLETDATDGDIVTFQVKVANIGSGSLEVSWWRCGEMLESVPGRREIIQHDDGWYELIISNIGEDDDGEYECRAENDQGFTSCFGSLYYYLQGAPGTATDVTLASSLQEGTMDGRQSALLILIDDGSHTDEGGSNKKSLTVSEQMQGIIEDLTNSSQGERTNSITLEKEDEEQFNSDIDDLLEEALQEMRGSQDTLVPEILSPDSGDKAMSEGASDPYAVRVKTEEPERCRSNPTKVASDQNLGSCPWPAETVVTFDVPDTSTTSVDLPPMDTEEGTKNSIRTLGADTPFGVDDIPAEESMEISCFATPDRNGASKISEIAGTLPRSVAFQDISSVKQEEAQKEARIEEESTFTSVTDIQDLAALYEEGLDCSKMSASSFRSTSLRLSSDVSEDLSRTAVGSSVSSRTVSRFQEDVSASSFRASRSTRRIEEDSFSAKRSKISIGESELSTSARSAKGTSRHIEMEVASAESKGLDVYTAIMNFKPMESDQEAVEMKEGQRVEVIDATKPRRWLVRTIPVDISEEAKEGWVPACYLEKSTAEDTISSFIAADTSSDPKILEALENREAVVQELVESEEDFSKDMLFVVDNYYKQIDDANVPKEIRDRKGSIFGNFKDICDFHNNVLMKGVNYHSKEPTKLGKTFLRLERDFDMHASYCWNEARAQKILQSGVLHEYFEQYSKLIGDDKILTEHLKLPIQRLNDYQLLLKEIIKYSSRLNEDVSDLQKALEFIHSINKRTKDLQYVQSIQGCTGDLLKLGRIIKHDVFQACEDDSNILTERHVFLFKGRILLAKKSLTSTGNDGNESFDATSFFKLHDVDVVDSVPEDERRFIFKQAKKKGIPLPIVLQVQSLDQKECWLKEIYSNLQITEELGDEEPALVKPISTELKHKVEEIEAHPKEPAVKKHKAEEVTKPVETLEKVKRQTSVEESKKISKTETATSKIKSEKNESDISSKRKITTADKEGPEPKCVKEPSSPSVDPHPKTEKPRTEKQESVTSPTKGSDLEKDTVKDFKPAESGMAADKPRFGKPVRGVTYSLGETAVLECETEGSPTPSVTWLKDNKRLSKNKRMKPASVGQSHSLTLKETVADDAGLYTVVANNAHGSASCSAPLNLKLSLLGLPKEDSRPSTPGGTILPHAPKFKVKLNKETQLLEGTSVRFELVVRGNPEPSVKFFKDEKELKLDDRIRISYETKEVFELILDHVVAKDAGTYSCVASNHLGSDTTTVTLSVVKHKDVFRGLEECFDEGREPTPRPITPKFKWFKNGQDFEASERFQVMFNEEEDSLALMFQHVTPDDAGLYTCVASTSTGSKIACSAELTVQGVIRQVEVPGIKTELSDVEATEGGSAMLELKITGFPKPKVTWFHKKKEVTTGGRYRFLFADEESFTLIIKNVKKDDSGAYSVKAINEVGEAVSSCQLTVNSAPSCVKGLKDMSVMAEEDINLEIEVEGNPAPEVKWYKDGQLLNASDKVKILDLGNKKFGLKVVKAKQGDSGSYSCVLTNALGSQAEFSNVVVKASPTFVKGMENVEGLEGDSLHFTVEISGNPKPTLRWLKDGKEIKVDGKHIKVIEKGINTYILAVENAVLSDAGAYSCEIKNEHGVKSSSGNLSLKTKPEFVKKLSDIEANEGDANLTLSVSVKGHPAPSIKWMFNGEGLADNKAYMISSDSDSSASLKTHSLKIKKVARGMSGKYTCEAKNDMGATESAGTLTVKVVEKEPAFDVGLKPAQFVEGKPGKLEAKVSGEPTPKITWMKDGNPITPGGRYRLQQEPDGTLTLLIDQVTSDDAGLYSIVAKSDLGEAKSEAQISTIPPGRKPEFVKQLEEEITLIEGHPLLLTSKVIGNPTLIKWQKDGKDISSTDLIKIDSATDGTLTLKVNKVSPDDAGKYAVIASNAEGKARSAGLLRVKACAKPSIDMPLESLTLSDGATGQLKAKISGEPKPSIRWLKDGRDLKTNNRVATSEDPDGTVSLTINNSRTEDAGKYAVVAENVLGEVSSTAPVLINQAPSFLKGLSPVNVVEGYPAKLEAKIGGFPAPELKWMKEGKEFIPDGVHCKEVRSPDGTVALVFDNCKPEDAGKYSLLAKNNLGESSSDGKLTIAEASAEGEPESIPCFKEPLGDVSLKEGDVLRLEAKVSGNPLPEITWCHNEKPIMPADGILMTFDGQKAVLEIRNCTPEHAGKYKCILSNPLGKASSDGTVSVEEKTIPRFTQRLTDYNGFVGSPLILICKAKGYPEPDIDWYFNGKIITPGPKYSITKAGGLLCLSMNNCQMDDSGIFECRATNPLGEDTTRSAVNMSDKIEKGEPPSFLKKIGECEVMEGMTAKFTACITGNPTPEVKWAKDGQSLELSSRHKAELESTGILRLVIKDVDPSDYGEYSVAISNCHGSATSSAHIRPDSLDQKYIKPMGDQFIDFDKFKKLGAPVPLSDKPRIVRMTDDALTLAWKPSVPTAARIPVTYQIEMAKHPGGEYIPYKSGLKDTLCDIRGLIPGQDYKFRIRVESKSGISEPSPYTTANRSRVRHPYTPAEFQPRDYEIEHPPLKRYAAPPKFIMPDDDRYYGIPGQPITIQLWLYGCPEPEVTWYKNDIKVSGENYGFLHDRGGKLCLFINNAKMDSFGTYVCHAKNSEGEAKAKIELVVAVPPAFTKRLDETTAMNRRSTRMQCQVTGIPYPSIKWYRDWHPLYESDRVKILREDPDKCTLFLTNLITRDAGLFSCSAANVAGTVSSSASLNVEDSEDTFDRKTYSHPFVIKPRTKLFDDFYDLGEELGRGTQGVVYHAVKRDTGDCFAAKVMNGTGKLRDFMYSEKDIMNQICHSKLLRLWDAFETKSSLSLITDLCGGGELLPNILDRGTLTEREVAYYIKQLLEGLEHMHGRYIGHLGLTVGDLLVERVNSYDIKVGDFGLSAHLIPGKDYFLEYGHPEFVAPEIANKQPASLVSDMWSVGVITYLLLSGLSPFLGEHDRETLTRVKEGKINFSENAFLFVTDDAKDFMSKVLVFDPSGRMNVKTALQHRWIKDYADLPSSSDKFLDNIERLRDYYKKWKNWYANASCKWCYRRRTLESCFHHPSKMIYPPGESFTPEGTPELDIRKPHVKPSQFDDTFQQKINREGIDFRSESSYQNGPDTYLLQLRDPDFPLRIRQYLRVGARTSPTLAASLRDCHWGDSTLVIRERRKFVDVMDEEIDDEQKGLTTRTVPMRLHHEVGTLGFAHEQMESLKKEVWKDKGSRELEIGMAPFFREKIRDVVMKEDDEVVFKCLATGTPPPSCTWFRNDGILLESSRIVVTQTRDGGCELRIKPSRAYDVGVYKCVARNCHGVTVCRARLKIGGKPGRPEPPVVKQSSGTECYLAWTNPIDEGHSSTLCYALEYKTSASTDWIQVAKNISHEYFVLRNLQPSTSYMFRVKAFNKFGWGEPGFATDAVITKEEGAPKVEVSTRRKFQQEMTEGSDEYVIEEPEALDLDYNIEKNPVPLVEGETLELYRVISEMDRGRFSVILNVWVKESGTTSTAKVIKSSSNGAASDGKKEYEIMKSLCHDRIVTLLSASYYQDKTVLVMEKLSGVDVLTFLSCKQDYNEELVVKIIKQVLDAIEYLHFRGICYIELQPDNVVMVEQRHSDIKLVDFGSARFVPKAGGKVLVEGTPEYLAPEVLKQEEVRTGTDVWCVGVLAYILLSGVSPFRGKTEEETVENVRYARFHYDNLYREVTLEATHFLLQVFKACPIKRPTASECLENKWLAPSEYMIMKRESARFLTDKLAAFSKSFHTSKAESMDPEMLTSLGMSSNRVVVKDEDF